MRSRRFQINSYAKGTKLGGGAKNTEQREGGRETSEIEDGGRYLNTATPQNKQTNPASPRARTVDETPSQQHIF